MVDEIVEERGCEVERADPLALDQVEGGACLPPGEGDVAAADEVHREERVHAHGVVERHHAERAVARGVPVLQRL